MKLIMCNHRTARTKQKERKKSKVKPHAHISKTALKMSSHKNNQSDEHKHRCVMQIVSPNPMYTATTWGASCNAIHAFYSVDVRDSLSLRSLPSLLKVAEITTHL